jgi:cytochrome c-type biogenesis protein CcmH
MKNLFKRSGLIVFIFCMLYLFFGQLAQAVSAQVETPPIPTPSDDDVNAIAGQMYCPVCENIPLDQCGTQACSQWRELIRQKLSEGLNAEGIKAYFAAQYGDNVLSEPPRRGLNWLVYILPPLALATGAVFLFYFLARRRKTAPIEVEETQTGDRIENDPYMKKLEEELKKRERE